MMITGNVVIRYVNDSNVCTCILSTSGMQLRDGSTTAIESRANADRTIALQQMPSSGAPDVRPGTNRLPGGACIPPFLEEWKVKILRTGKYLNVIRECGLPVEGESSPDSHSWEVQEKANGSINMEGPK